MGKGQLVSTIVLLAILVLFALVFTGNRGEGSNIITRVINDLWQFAQSLPHP